MKAKEFLKYRNIWMAIAIILVTLFHWPIQVENSILKFIKDIGYGGVDIFFFASGIGCYYSFMKDEDILGFLKRRFWKIMPIYWSFIVIFLLAKILFDEMPFHSIIGNIFAIENFTSNGNEFNWYISAIWLFYLLTPVLAKIVQKIDSSKKFIFCLIILLLFSVSFWNSKTLIITVVRLPIYFLGMYVAKTLENKDILSKKSIIFSFIILIIGFLLLLCLYKNFSYNVLWNFGFFWYPYILIVPGFCIIISIISHFLEKYKIFNLILKTLKIIGANTFEIFLVHAFLFAIYPKLIFFINIPDFIILLLVIPATIMFKYYYKIIMFVFNKINSLYSKKNIKME